LLGDRGAAGVTTLLDYYGLPDDFPGMTTRPAKPRDRVAHVEAELARTLGSPQHFLPHVVLHEYEAWIYSAPTSCAWAFDDPKVPPQLEGIAKTAGGAELIDEGPQTAPSKRLLMAREARSVLKIAFVFEELAMDRTQTPPAICS
jgi:hypothetical protein